MSDIRVNNTKLGMKLNKNASEIQEGEYTLAVNANVLNSSGDVIKLTNEPATVLCSRFKPGYKVIGVLPINTKNKTIFFLVHPNLGKSEIGYISNTYYSDSEDVVSGCCNDLQESYFNNLPICKYYTITDADCLNFNIDYPVTATFEIGYDFKTGESNCDKTTIFFTDFYNPRRYINIDNIPYITTPSGDCNVPVSHGVLDCNAIKVVPDFKQPCINYLDVVLGGTNKAGVYQFAIAYSNPNSEPFTEYSLVTNPISLYSKTRITTVATDYNTDKAIKLEINDIDTNFKYFNLVVLKTINLTTSCFLVGTFPINSSSFQYTYTGNNYANEIPVPIEKILQQKPVYEYAKGVAPANKHLFWYNLKEQRQINLQPVVSKIPLKWQTIEAKEGFYGNPLSANYVSYERDEVVPFGIEFKTSNGAKLPTFLFVGKDKDYYLSNGIDVEQIVTGNNVLSSTGCSPEPLNKLWQVYNVTTTPSASPCYSNPTGEATVTIPTIKECKSLVWYINPSGFPVDANGNLITPPNPCCNPSGDCNQDSVDYCCCEIVTVNPSGVVKLPVYTCKDITIVSPLVANALSNYEVDNTITGETIPSGVNFAATPTWVPQSNLCSSARSIFPSNTGNCAKESLIATNTTDATDIISLNELPYLYFTEAGITTVPVGEQTDCSGTPITVRANSYWLQFNAISENHLLSLNVNKDYIVKVLEGDSCDSLTEVINIDPSTYPTCVSSSGNTTTCITLNNLIAGNTYYIQVFLNEDLGSADTVGFGQICLSTPTPTTYIDYTVNKSVRWVCNYRDGEEKFTYPADPTCFVTPYEYGDFAYWESTITYPNNPEIWGDLCGKPIRHFKFPDCCISHIHNHIPKPQLGHGLQPTQTNKIYPIGVRIDINDIKNALNEAVSQGLITEEEKLKITSFSIKRGDRRSNRSIIAKGLLYDLMKTKILDVEGSPVGDKSSDFNYYPNYPYNDLHDDVFLLDKYEGSHIKHPYYNNQYRNNRYTFHSANTSFNRPELGNELKLETIEYGLTFGTASRVDKHAEYVLLRRKAYDVAKTFAALQINNEASLQAFSAGASPSVLGTSAGSIVMYVIYYAIGLATGFATNYTKYTNEWLDIFKSLGNPKNPAIYLTSVGNYNNYSCVENSDVIPKRRSLINYKYLDSGNYNFSENGEFVKINNFERESSVYLSIPQQFPFNSPSSFTNIPADDSRKKECVINTPISSVVTSYYASVKNYIPDQYGNVESIQWIDTGYCGRIEWDNEQQDTSCDTIFGGDTYINRFSFKRKMPFFIQDRVNFPENTPVMYQNLANVGFPEYFFNSLQNDSSLDKFKVPFLAPPLVNFDCDTSVPFYYKGKFYLYNYGIPSFITESDYNIDLRHAEDDGNYKDFYPHVADVVEWTQQYKNPISFDNTYYYNLTYSKQNKENFSYSLKNTFKQNLSDCQATYPNRTIYSGQGVNNWLDYLVNDYYDFPLEDGKLIAINGTEKDRVFVRQENSAKVFNAYITQESSLETIQISVGDMFATKPQEYYKTDLGFGGSNHQAFISTPFGQFYVDSQNSSILNLSDGLQDITRDKDTGYKIQWFVNNLPFNITKDFPEVNVDNNYKYFGIALTWDNKFDRVLITKKDYKLLPEFKNKVSYIDNKFYYNNIEILPTNSTYFCDKSWTIAYSPLLKEWISFYSFTPNYYLSTERYFASGVNYSNDPTEYGIWNHLQTLKLFQTFYGKQCPFIVETATKDTITSSILQSVSYQAEFRRYTDDDLNYALNNTITFNKAVVYNQNQSSGYLNLIPKEKNNLFQLANLSGGIYKNNEMSILVDNVENTWRFNDFYDYSIQNGQPLLSYNCNTIYKDINEKSLDYSPKFFKNRMRSDYFNVRLINDKHFNHQIVIKPILNQSENSQI